MLNAAKRTLIQKRLTDKTHAMSSNIRITKCCVYCGQEFTAKTIHTRYCSHVCNQRGYKKTEREKKLDAAKERIRVEPLNIRQDRVNWEELTRKPYLTVSEACLVLNVRVETLRRWIKEGTVKTSRIGKKHLIERGALMNLKNAD
jgi:excisionase family DNA binding protein